MSTYNIKLRDNDGSVGITGIPVQAAATDPALQAFYDATVALALGTPGEGYVSERIVKQVGSDANSADPVARKEMYWHCKFTDNVNGLKGSFSIPTASPSLTPGSIDLDTSAGVGATLKAAFEAIAESRTGNPVTLNSIQLKGRKSS